MEEKIDRLENHFKVYKSDMVDVKDTLKDIKILLAGNQMNGNKGLIHLMDKVNDRVNEIEKEMILLDDGVTTFKWSVRAFVGGVISIIIWFFTKK